MFHNYCSGTSVFNHETTMKESFDSDKSQCLVDKFLKLNQLVLKKQPYSQFVRSLAAFFQDEFGFPIVFLLEGAYNSSKTSKESPIPGLEIDIAASSDPNMLNNPFSLEHTKKLLIELDLLNPDNNLKPAIIADPYYTSCFDYYTLMNDAHLFNIVVIPIRRISDYGFNLMCFGTSSPSSKKDIELILGLLPLLYLALDKNDSKTRGSYAQYDYLKTPQASCYYTVAFALLDINFNLLWCNNDFKERFSYNKEYISNSQASILERVLEEELETFKKTLNDSSYYSKCMLLCDTKGKTSHVIFEISLIKENVSNEKSYIISLTDVSDNITLENDLKQSLWELEEKNRIIESQRQKVREVGNLKNAFIDNMSHELRTPLNNIIGFSETLHNNIFGGLNQKQKEYVNVINENGRHLLNLVNDILDISKIEGGQFSVYKEKINLHTETTLAINSLRNMFTAKKVKIYNLIPSSMCAYADPKRYSQIIGNLLSNAIKFSEPYESVEVSALRNNDTGMIEISVKDNGIGIEKENLDSIFETFKQLDDAHNRKQEGIGLGLAIVKSLIKLHSGDIWVNSSPGKGTTFTFSLPGYNNNVLYISTTNMADSLKKEFNENNLNLIHKNDYDNQEDNLTSIIINEDIKLSKMPIIIANIAKAVKSKQLPVFLSSQKNTEDFCFSGVSFRSFDTLDFNMISQSLGIGDNKDNFGILILAETFQAYESFKKACEESSYSCQFFNTLKEINTAELNTTENLLIIDSSTGFTTECLCDLPPHVKYLSIISNNGAFLAVVGNSFNNKLETMSEIIEQK